MAKPAPKSALEHQAPHATKRVQGTIRVRALKRGFYDHCLQEPNRGEDSIFYIRSSDELGSWMELAPEGTVDEAGDATADTKPAAGKAEKGGKAEKKAAAGKSENDVL